MRRSFFILAAWALPGALFATVYSVSPGGDDAAAGSLAAPWKTLAHAASIAQAGDTVQLRQGVYREVLNAVRSGTAAAPITFEGAPGESAVLAGSDLVNGTWSVDSGNVWRIDGLPATTDVFVDGQEMPEARWPNVAPGAAMNVGWALADSGSNSTTLVDSALPSVNLTGAQVRIIPGAAWVAYSRTVQAYGGGQFTFSSTVGGSTAYWPTLGNRYYLFRHRALLDAAGEWFQDPATNRLYLWLPDSGTPSSHQIEIASRRDVVYANGQNYLQFKNFFTFSGGININASSGTKVLGVGQRYVHHRADVDGYNFELTHNQMNGGTGGEWSGGSIEGSSGDGIFIAGTGHTVQDMLIHDVCQIGTYRGAVRMAGSGHLITHNTFYDSGRFLIFHDQSKGGELSYNHLYNAGLLTNDLGATYCYRANGGKMEIHHNIVHNLGYTVGAGIYLDNASSNFVIDHNLVYNVTANALILNLPSYDNLVVNNTLYATKNWVNSAGSQYPQEMTGTVLVNNLYSGGQRLITGAMAPTLITNGSYTAPPAIFNTGAWTLAAGSPAIDKGTVYNPHATVYCGAKPDQGCYESACGAPWTAGDGVTPPSFPYPLPGGSGPTPTFTRSRTATPSPTPTATRSRTATPSPSATGTATPSASSTSSSTRTRTATATSTLTPTSSATRSITTSATSSPAPSLSVSATSTPTPTRSSTPAAATATATSTATISTTVTQTPAVTSSPSQTATFSDTRTLTATSSPTLSVTETPADSATFSPTGTLSKTVSPTPSSSATATGTRSPSASITPSVSGTASGTLTLTATPSTSATPSATLTATPSGTPTASATLSATRTSTVMTSPTSSVTPTLTRSPTATPGSSSTASPTPSAVQSATASPSITITADPTPDFSEGPLAILALQPYPNPNPQGWALHLDGAVDKVTLRIYSVAGTCVSVQHSGALPRGWSQLPLDAAWLAAAPNGLYFAQAVAEQGGRHSAPSTRVKLLRLR